MGKRLSAKFKKAVRDQARAVKEGKTPARHKVSKERAKRALFRKAHVAT